MLRLTSTSETKLIKYVWSTPFNAWLGYSIFGLIVIWLMDTRVGFDLESYEITGGWVSIMCTVLFVGIAAYVLQHRSSGANHWSKAVNRTTQFVEFTESGIRYGFGDDYVVSMGWKVIANVWFIDDKLRIQFSTYFIDFHIDEMGDADRDALRNILVQNGLRSKPQSKK